MNRKNKAFALPTVLIASVVLLSVLVTTVSATVAIRSTLQEQHYTELAQLAGEAGTVYAKNCIEKNAGLVTWTDSQPLKPNTNCSGVVVSGLSPYILEQGNIRTYFVVNTPIANNIPSRGYLEALRTSTGIAWRVWGSTASAQSTNSDALPVGTSVSGYWTSPPSGYLLENGAAVSRTTYADLFAVIGTTFGAGDGSTTFNLPDSRGRVAVNKSTDTEFDVLGEKSGEKVHTLTNSEVPATAVRTDNATPNVGWRSTTGEYDFSSAGTYRRLINGDLSGQLHVDGGGQAHNNIQPSIVVLRVIKY